ncbi:MAG: 50S ribosomal protein L32 [Planctomycetota bacterium]|nr:50S ribosomal protein L32 [Planctomycetota bacterium]
MAVPKRKKSYSRVRTRRSHHALKRPTLGECPQCGGVREPHRVCPHCGYYRDRVVIEQDEE